MKQIIAQLQQGLDALNLTLKSHQQSQLVTYIELLQKWNRIYNLTAITHVDRMIPYLLLDSLTVLTYLKGASIMDLGTGAGIPGIPLACCCPEKQFTLIDASEKKIRFVKQAVYHLGLKNIDAVHARIEQYPRDMIFDTIVTRAVGAIDNIMRAAAHLVAPGSRWIFMKGAHPETELSGHLKDAQIVPVHVPGITQPRHIVYIDEPDHSHSQSKGRRG